MQATIQQPHTDLRLRASRREASRNLQAQLTIGQAIRTQRIRDMRDLDEARREKQEWVLRTGEMLSALVNQSALADQFNDYVPTILPEFAEFQMFVDTFEDEMRHRLGRLQTFAKAIGTLAEPGAVAPTPHPELAPTLDTVLDSAIAASPPLSEQAPRAARQEKPVGVSGLMIWRGGDVELRERVSQFLSRLGIELRLIDQTSAQPGSIGEALRQGTEVSFVLFAGDGIDGADQSHESAFQLGCFVGRVGVERVITLHRTAGAQPLIERFGLARVVVDASDGWQLQLARQLRKSNVQIDLNRLL